MRFGSCRAVAVLAAGSEARRSGSRPKTRVRPCWSLRPASLNFSFGPPLLWRKLPRSSMRARWGRGRRRLTLSILQPARVSESGDCPPPSTSTLPNRCVTPAVAAGEIAGVAHARPNTSAESLPCLSRANCFCSLRAHPLAWQMADLSIYLGRLLYRKSATLISAAEPRRATAR